MATTKRHRGITFTIYLEGDRYTPEYDHLTARRNLTPELVKVVNAIKAMPGVTGAYFTTRDELIVMLVAGTDVDLAQGKIMQTIEYVTV